jgi:hypothetical protein
MIWQEQLWMAHTFVRLRMPFESQIQSGCIENFQTAILPVMDWQIQSGCIENFQTAILPVMDWQIHIANHHFDFECLPRTGIGNHLFESQLLVLDLLAHKYWNHHFD